MADISVADIKALRDATGAGMMDAKKALEEAQAKAKEAQSPEQDGGVANAQAEIDDQRTACIRQYLPKHDVPWPLTAGLRSSHIVAGLDVHHQAPNDTEYRR